MNLAIPLQIARLLPADACRVRLGPRRFRQFTPEQLTQPSFWDTLSAPERRALRQLVIGQMRTWELAGTLDKLPVEVADCAVGMGPFLLACPREAKALQKAGLRVLADFAAYSVNGLMALLGGRSSTVLRVLHGLEACAPDPAAMVPLPQPPAPPVDTEQPLDPALLERAIASAGGVDRSDLRLGALLADIDPEAVNIEATLQPRLGRATQPAAVVALVEEVVRLDNLNLAEDIADVGGALVNVFQRDVRERNATIFAERYGSSGDDSRKLESVGERYGLTRERVRQITAKMLARRQLGSLFSPAFLRLQQACAKALPGAASQWQEDFAALLGGIQIDGARAYASEVLGLELPLERQIVRGSVATKVKTRVFWSSTSDEAWQLELLSQARRMIATHGAAFLPGLVAKLDGGGSAPAMHAAERVASMFADFEWLNAARNWFWLGPPQQRNRLDLALRKMMSVAGRHLDIEDIFHGVARFSRLDAEAAALYPPPMEVVQAICERLPWLRRRQYNDFCATPAIAPDEVLSRTELTVYNCMAANRGVASRRMIFDALQAGTTTDQGPILAATLTNCCFIRQLDRGVFGLVGWPLDSAALVTAQREVGAENIAVESDENGWYEWTVQMTAASVRNGQHIVPARIANAIVQGRYTIDGASSVFVGAQNRMRGISAYAKRRRWRLDSLVTVRLQPATMQAMVALAAEPDGRAEPSGLTTYPSEGIMTP